MKICPRCQRTYTDDNLNFCLDDGVVLQQTAGQQEPPATVFMNQPPPTDPRAAQPSQPAVQPAWNTAPQQFGQAPKKSSKAWIWVLVILALVVVICASGSVIGLYLIGKSAEQTAYNAAISNTSTNSNKVTFPGNKTTGNSTNTAGPTSSPNNGNVEDLDLSEWVKDFSAYGTTEFTDGEFRMASKQKGYYYVLVAPETYSTEGATTRVTVRNIDNADSRYGYGLIFHSNPSPLIQDYAFLIDAKKKRYRVVHHEPQDEKAVVQWTNSNVIKDGTQENVLEVRDKTSDNKVDLYINGQLVNSITNTYGYKGGVPGLYAGDGAKAGFKNLQIVK